MLADESTLVLALLTAAALAYFIASLVPRVDEQEASYRKFAALTTAGIAYLVVLVLVLAIVADATTGPVGTALAIAVGAFVLFGVTLLGQVVDDWLRLFADPEYNTLVELSMVLGVIVVLLVIGLVPP